ncbi:MAG: dihydrolipoamide acetyltransferase family protein [Chloroflexi bacterium]|nr:dihydrolipoamide acetyltransferase family protein [Chloroflexota bacterium]
MAELITMPKLGFDMAEGKLQEWVAKAGAAVREGEVIAIVETDKASVEVPAFRSGVLHTILVEAGVSVPIGKPIAVISNPGEAVDLAALGLVKVEAKAEVKVEAAAKVKAETERPVAPQVEAAGTAEGGRLLASPVALRMAAELGIDLHKVAGTGPAGRIIKRDIETYVQERAAAPEKPATPVAAPPIPTPSFEPTMEGYRAVPLTPMRQTIARRMVESKQTVPHFYVTMDVDMAAAMALRSQLNALVPESEKISVNDFIVKAAALALRQFPNVNASFAGAEIHIHDQVNIGMAVARENGLITAVLRDCDKKPLAQIAREARELVARTREGRMKPDDMMGATFTISNLGMFDVDDFSAIITLPQAAALAVGAVKQQPVVKDGQLAVGTRMKMTISADHRVTDGAEAARFLQAVKAVLEQPLRLVL